MMKCHHVSKTSLVMINLTYLDFLVNRSTLSDDSDDTDSDVLFENSRQKSNGARNGFKGSRTHKFTKLGRRIKT